MSLKHAYFGKGQQKAFSVGSRRRCPSVDAVTERNQPRNVAAAQFIQTRLELLVAGNCRLVHTHDEVLHRATISEPDLPCNSINFLRQWKAGKEGRSKPFAKALDRLGPKDP